MTPAEWSEVAVLIAETFDRVGNVTFWRRSMGGRDRDVVERAIYEVATDPAPGRGTALQRVNAKIRAYDESIARQYQQGVDPKNAAGSTFSPFEAAMAAEPFQMGEGVERRARRRFSYVERLGWLGRQDAAANEAATEAVRQIRELAETLGATQSAPAGKPWKPRGTEEHHAAPTAEQREKRSWWRCLFADRPDLRMRIPGGVSRPPQMVSDDDRRLAAAYERRMRSEVEGWANPYGKGGATC